MVVNGAGTPIRLGLARLLAEHEALTAGPGRDQVQRPAAAAAVVRAPRSLATPLLLERLALAGALVTMDAMGCQTRIAQAILDRGGDYLLAIKDNHSNLHDEIRRLFDDPGTRLHSRFDAIDGDHGRVEVRRHRVSPQAVIVNNPQVIALVCPWLRRGGRRHPAVQRKWAAQIAFARGCKEKKGSLRPTVSDPERCLRRVRDPDLTAGPPRPTYYQPVGSVEARCSPGQRYRAEVVSRKPAAHVRP